MSKAGKQVRGFAAKGGFQFYKVLGCNASDLMNDRVALAERKIAVGVLYLCPQKGCEQLWQHVSMG